MENTFKSKEIGHPVFKGKLNIKDTFFLRWLYPAPKKKELHLPQLESMLFPT